MPPRSKPRLPTIVVIGSINVDLVTRVSRHPRPGETITGESFHTLPGGKGANQAVAAARLGGRVQMVGRVGDDAFGRKLRLGLKAEGVDVRQVRVTPGAATGCATILVDRKGENSIVVTPGANALLTADDVTAAEPLIRGAAVVVMQLEVPVATILHAVALCRRLGVRTILDPAPVPPDGPPSGLLDVDVLTPNETESFGLLGPNVALSGGDPGPILARKGPRAVVFKLGQRGASIREAPGTFETSVHGYRVKVVDTTAAGDAFTGALAVATAESKPMVDAVRFANAAGALCCTKLGAQQAMPTLSEVQTLLRRRQGDRRG